MKKCFAHIFLLLLALLACTREKDFVPVEEDGAPEGRVTVTFSVLADHNPDTKALGEANNLDTDRMYLAIFGGSGYFKEYIHATLVSKSEEAHSFKIEDSEGNETTVNKTVEAFRFKADLQLSNTPRTIHFLGNGPVSIRAGRDRDVLPILLGEYETAFWQMVQLPEITALQIDDNYVKPDGNGGYTPRTSANDPYVISDETKAYFPETGIALIRNWSKIVLRNSPTSNFTPHSFAVVNVPKKGTLVPYGGKTGWITDYQNKDFDDLFKSDGLYVYGGNLPEGTEFDDSVPSIDDFLNCENGVVRYDPTKFDKDEEEAVYLYERPAPQGLIPPSYVIVYGKYYREDDTALTQAEKDAGGVDCFYKIDLMNEGVYYPIYRNFKYKIQIDKISARGHNNPKSAAASAGSADVSADVNAKHLQDISDGTRRMRVEPWLSKTFIQGEESEDHLYVVFYDNVTVDNPKPNTEKASVEVKLLPSDVGAISNIVIGDPVGKDEDENEPDNYGWRTISFKINDPGEEMKVSRTQTLRILCNAVGSTESPLYRDVVITVQPRQEMRVSCQYPRVLRQAGNEQAVDVSIPDGLPESMFPLIFTLEPLRMTLTPDNSKGINMPVLSGKSLSGSGKPAFQFERTLSWDEYNAIEAEFDRETETRWRTFTSYFKTNCEDSGTKVLVSNKYFIGDETEFQTYMSFTRACFTTPVPCEDQREVEATASLLSSTLGYKPVYLELKGLEPAADSGIEKDPETGELYFQPSALVMNFKLKTTTTDGDVSITLSSKDLPYEDVSIEPWHFRDFKIMETVTNNYSNVAYGYVRSYPGVSILTSYYTDPDSYWYTAENKIGLSVPSASGVAKPDNWNNGNRLSGTAEEHYREKWFTTTEEGISEPVSITLSAKGYVEETVTAPRFWGTLYNWNLQSADTWNKFINAGNSFQEEKTENNIKRIFTFNITADKTIRRHDSSNGILLPAGGHYELKADLETDNEDFYIYYAQVFYHLDGDTPLKPRSAEPFPDGSVYYGYQGNNNVYCWNLPWGQTGGRLVLNAPYNQDVVITRVIVRGFHGVRNESGNTGGGDIGFGGGGLNDGGGL